jgi:hypothetical protein
MIAAFSIAISLLAVGFSFFVFIDNRRKDQRDTFLRLHQILNDDDMQRGRYLLFQKAFDQTSVEQLTDNEWRDMNRVVSTFNTLGFYIAKHYVSESDVLEIWARPVVRIWTAAQPYIAYRESLQGYRPWRYFDLLAGKAQEYISSKVDNVELKVWRRPGTAAPIAPSPPEHKSDAQD